jgi:uncharacterized OB-fold protein
VSSPEPSVQTRAGQERLRARGVKPRPAPDALTRPYWEAARREELRILRCTACRRFRHPPTPACPECAATGTEWVLLSGRGEVYSFIVDYRLMVPGFSEPYVVAQVVPVEATSDTVRITTNIRGCPPEEVRIGMSVQVEFEPLDEEITLPQFAPVSGSSEGNQ